MEAGGVEAGGVEAVRQGGSHRSLRYDSIPAILPNLTGQCPKLWFRTT